MSSAACSGVATDIFFPEVGTSYSAAKAICGRCPVLDRCREETDRLERHLSVIDISGLYAGETPAARLRRRSAERELAERRVQVQR
jgi:WhiB family transcriptional regulator, redox-sensing transcriptional regulator